MFVEKYKCFIMFDFCLLFFKLFFLLLWNYFLSKSFWGKFAQWTIFLLFRFIKYCVDDLLKIYHFKPKIKKKVTTVLHIQFQFLITVLLRQEWSHLVHVPVHKSIQIKTFMKNKKMENCTLCSQMAGGCGIKMMWKFLGCIFFLFQIDDG